MRNKEEVKAFVRRSYGKIAVNNANSCGCGCSGESEDLTKLSERIGYTVQEILDAPEGSNMGLGCGNPVAIASLKEGETVLDLGSGGGFDSFLARKKVGEKGFVIGVDMTHEMIHLSRMNLEKTGYTNVEFRLGEIEHLPVADNSVDIIISNCVINLSPEKEQVFREAYRVLKTGGRLSIADLVAVTEIPDEIMEDLRKVAACYGGAEQIDNLRKILQDAGFKNIKFTPVSEITNVLTGKHENHKMNDFVKSYIIEAVK